MCLYLCERVDFRHKMWKGSRREGIWLFAPFGGKCSSEKDALETSGFLREDPKRLGGAPWVL